MTPSFSTYRFILILLFLTGCSGLAFSSSSYYQLYPGSSLNRPEISLLTSKFDDNIKNIVEQTCEVKITRSGMQLKPAVVIDVDGQKGNFDSHFVGRVFNDSKN